MTSASTGSSWTPGHRRIPGELKSQPFHKKVTATATLGLLQAVQYDADEEDVYDLVKNYNAAWAQETGQAVLLSLRFPSRAGILVNLSTLTEIELDMLKDFVVDSIERARPSVQKRDAIAREAEGNGDYSFARSNRPDPKVVGHTRKL